MQKFGDGLDDEDDESGDEDPVLSASLSRSRSSEGIKEKVKIDSISKIDFSQDIALEKIANSLAEINLKQSEIERLINSQDQQDLEVLERKKEILERKKEKLQNMQTNNNSINNLAKNYDILGKNRKSATIDDIKGILARKRTRERRNVKAWNIMDNHYEDLHVKKGRKVLDAAFGLASKGSDRYEGKEDNHDKNRGKILHRKRN